MKTVLVAAAALIDADKRILMAQRPPGKPMAGLWEFPGGKVEPGEMPETALIRELREELGIKVCHSCLSAGPFVSHYYTEKPPKEEPGCGCPVDAKDFMPASTLGLKSEFHLLMPLYLCRKWEGIPQPLEGQKLRWQTLQEILTLPLPPADKPLLYSLRYLL